MSKLSDDQREALVDLLRPRFTTESSTLTVEQNDEVRRRLDYVIKHTDLLDDDERGTILEAVRTPSS